MNSDISFRSGCPLSSALDLVGDKWSLLIIRDMIFLQKKYFKDFLNSSESIATNILSARLNKLECLGLVDKSKDPDNKRQWIYEPTQKALDLLPAIVELIIWSIKLDLPVGIPLDMKQSLMSNKNSFIEQTISKFYESNSS
ncbi:MAG: helix-turn-helix transcriptional regulator [Kangiellaceae bacterium]|nr:helix-turn-helix transcriptional regulator [Kangiellaceae bacterium]